MPNESAISDDDLSSFDQPQSENVKPPKTEEPQHIPNRTLSPQEREMVCKAIGVSNSTKGTAFQHHIKLKPVKSKRSRTVGGEVREAFERHGINPADLLVREIKIEAAKVEVYRRSEAHGVPQHVLDMLPKPDYERLDFLLLKIMKFFAPALSNTEITGTIDHSVKINLVQFQRKEERVIEHDEKSPAFLLAQNPIIDVQPEGEIEVPLEARMREEIEKELQNTTLKAKSALI